MPPESTNPLSYMSPLWTVLIVLVVLAVIAYLVAKPLHKYLTDRKTDKIIQDISRAAKSGEEETMVLAGEEKERGEEKKDEGEQGKDEEKGESGAKKEGT